VTLDIVALAGIYGMYACGLTLVFGVLEVLNLAHAATFAFCTLLAMYLTTTQAWPLWQAALITVLAGAVVAIAIDRIAFWPLRRRGAVTAWGKHIGPLLSSLALATILLGVDQVAFGLDPRHFPDRVLPTATLHLGSGAIPLVSAVSTALFVVLVIALTAALRKTRWGLEVRAVAEQSTTAALFGVNGERRFIETMAVSGALAALAGLAYGLTFNIASPDTSSQLDVKGFALVVLGGLGSVPGSLVGATVIAAIEVSGAKWLPHGTEQLLVFGVLFLLLVVRPQGIFGTKIAAGAR